MRPQIQTSRIYYRGYDHVDARAWAFSETTNEMYIYDETEGYKKIFGKELPEEKVGLFCVIPTGSAGHRAPLILDTNKESFSTLYVPAKRIWELKNGSYEAQYHTTPNAYWFLIRRAGRVIFAYPANFHNIATPNGIDWYNCDRWPLFDTIVDVWPDNYWRRYIVNDGNRYIKIQKRKVDINIDTENDNIEVSVGDLIENTIETHSVPMGIVDLRSMDHHSKPNTTGVAYSHTADTYNNITFHTYSMYNVYGEIIDSLSFRTSTDYYPGKDNMTIYQSDDYWITSTYSDEDSYSKFYYSKKGSGIWNIYRHLKRDRFDHIHILGAHGKYIFIGMGYFWKEEGEDLCDYGLTTDFSSISIIKSIPGQNNIEVTNYASEIPKYIDLAYDMAHSGGFWDSASSNGGFRTLNNMFIYETDPYPNPIHVSYSVEYPDPSRPGSGEIGWYYAFVDLITGKSYAIRYAGYAKCPI